LHGRGCLLVGVVEGNRVLHHAGPGLGWRNVVGLLVGPGMGSKAPAAGCSRELWPIGAHREAEVGCMVEGQGWGPGW
jgi:hypothetical protein